MKKISRIQILYVLLFLFFGKNAKAQFESCTIDTICQATETTHFLNASYVIPLPDFTPNGGSLNFEVINSSTIELEYRPSFWFYGLDSFEFVIGLNNDPPDTICFKIFVKQIIPQQYQCCVELNTEPGETLNIPVNGFQVTILDLPNNGLALVENSGGGEFISYQTDSMWTGIDSFMINFTADNPIGTPFNKDQCYVINVQEGSTSISKKIKDVPQILVFPNPFLSNFSYKIENLNPTDLTKLSIFDSTGKTIYREKNPPLTQNLDLEKLPKGIYFLQIQTTNQLITKKIIRQ